jgi:hypothetical protein
MKDKIMLKHISLDSGKEVVSLKETNEENIIDIE